MPTPHEEAEAHMDALRTIARESTTRALAPEEAAVIDAAAVKLAMATLSRPDPMGGCACVNHLEAHGEMTLEYNPACPEHSEHVYDPRTGAWEHSPESANLGEYDREEAHRRIEPFIAELTRSVTNETQAWNIWNNTASSTIARRAFEYVWTRRPHPAEQRCADLQKALLGLAPQLVQTVADRREVAGDLRGALGLVLATQSDSVLTESLTAAIERLEREPEGAAVAEVRAQALEDTAALWDREEAIDSAHIYRLAARAKAEREGTLPALHPTPEEAEAARAVIRHAFAENEYPDQFVGSHPDPFNELHWTQGRVPAPTLDPDWAEKPRTEADGRELPF